jgi:hypothetical protein
MAPTSSDVPVVRAPMRPRDRELPDGAGADHGLRSGVVAMGGVLEPAPATLAEAVAATQAEHGERAGRLLLRFAALPDGTFVWTIDGDGAFRLGRITGPWRYDTSAGARATGLHHARPADWSLGPIAAGDVPAGVAATFARGGRNAQRIHDADTERRTAALWEALAGG